jgi:hypothetical protein
MPAKESIINDSSEKMSRSKIIISVIFETLIFVLIALFILEAGSRLIHWGKRPAIPYITDSYGAPRMPTDIDFTIRLPNRDPHRLCTDSLGIRRIDCDTSYGQYKMLVIGDSQALGWGMDGQNSLAAKLGELSKIDKKSIGIQAVAGADVESLAPWTQEVALRNPGVEQVLLYINLGNDLDEMYLGRTSSKVALFPHISQWFGLNSFAYLDFTLIKQAIFGGTWVIPPDSNPVLFLLNHEESKVYAREISKAAEHLFNQWPRDIERTVVLVPNDYQVFKSEFDKYKPFYHSEAQFYEWRSKLEGATQMLNRYEGLLGTYLSQRSIQVVKARRSLKTLKPEIAFDRSSHHLTPTANEIVAKQIFSEFDGASKW